MQRTHRSAFAKFRMGVAPLHIETGRYKRLEENERVRMLHLPRRTAEDRKSCSFCLPRVPFVNCRQFMYLVISLLVLRAGYGI